MVLITTPDIHCPACGHDLCEGARFFNLETRKPEGPVDIEAARHFAITMRRGINYGPSVKCRGCGTQVSLARDEEVAAAFAD